MEEPASRLEQLLRKVADERDGEATAVILLEELQQVREAIDPDEIERGFNEHVLTACKLYPAGATTNSDAGVTDIRNVHPVLERLRRWACPC